jgi:hypothetical protein
MVDWLDVKYGKNVNSDAFDRIIKELTVHPKERIGFNRMDFDRLGGGERKHVLDRLLNEVDEGWGYAEQLKWMLGDSYVSLLKDRLISLPPKSHGRVFLPYFIYLETGQREYVLQVMQEIIEADPGWERRERAIGGYLRQLVGNEPVFWDFCRYVVLNVPGRAMKRNAMLWLAYQKGLIQELSLSAELSACLDALERTGGADSSARSALDGLHSDMRAFIPAK